jgi:hypothetical protein
MGLHRSPFSVKNKVREARPSARAFLLIFSGIFADFFVLENLI